MPSCPKCGLKWPIPEGIDAAQIECTNCGHKYEWMLVGAPGCEIAGVMTATKETIPGHSKKKGRVKETKQGNDWSHSLNRFVDVYQEVNLYENVYRKVVIDPKTGETLRNVEEPLSEHRDRGSAKPRKP